MQKAFRYRAYPNRQQEQVMTSLLETHRQLYNNALAHRKDVYTGQIQSNFHESEQRVQDAAAMELRLKTGFVQVTYKEQSAQLKNERKADDALALCNFSSCQRTLKRLERAFQAFFRRIKMGEKSGYPRFRGLGRFNSIDFTNGDGAKLTKDNKVYFQNVGNVKVKLHRPVEGKIKTVTFCRCADAWYVIFVCEIEQKITEASDLDCVPKSTNPPIGIDLGLKSFLVTSDGESVDTPKLYRKAQAKLRRSQRAVARKKRVGKNRRKAVNNLARVHQHVANQRKDFHHKVAKSLVDRYGLIAHEELNVKGMVRSLNLAKSTHDAGWSQFLIILSQKAECAVVKVVAVNPSHTTQMCSCCGCLPAVPIGLSVRIYTCEHCGFALDRDWNAAVNILNRAGTLPLQANVVGYDKRSARSLPL